MEKTLQTIDRLQKELQALMPMKPEYQQRLDKKIRLEFNYNSNHIEGNTLTYGETELLLIFDKTTGNHELREYEEMKSHDVAFEMIKEWAADKEMPLTELNIKNLHELLLVRPFWKEAITPDGQPTRRLIEVGNYKKYPNSVRLQNGEIFHYATPEETPIQMGELMAWYHNEADAIHPVTVAAMLHYKFVRIHPFDDGNGRLSRLLMNYVLLKNNLPPVIIKSGDKKNYLFALNQADTGNINAFIEYVATQLVWTLEVSVNAAKGESVDESEDWHKKLILLKRKLGEDPKDRVQITLGPEAFANVINNSFIPLALKWEEKLKEFDILLVSRTMAVSLDKMNYTINYLDKNFVARSKNYLNNKEISPSKIQSLRIQCNPRGLRKTDKSIGFNGGDFSIHFFQSFYEVNFTNNNKPINKLYHQSLKDIDMEEIANQLSNFLYNNIEKVIERNK